MASPTPRIWLKGSALSCIHQPRILVKKAVQGLPGQVVKNLPANTETQVLPLNQEDLHILGAS